MMIPFIQAHWLAILFGEYFVFVCIVFNTAMFGSIQDISDFDLKYIEYFFIFLFGIPFFLFEVAKKFVTRRFNNG